MRRITHIVFATIALLALLALTELATSRQLEGLEDGVFAPAAHAWMRSDDSARESTPPHISTGLSATIRVGGQVDVEATWTIGPGLVHHNSVRVVARGDYAYAHELGLMLTAPDCSDPMFLLVMSALSPWPDSLEDQRVSITISGNGVALERTVSVVHLLALTQHHYFAILSKMPFDEELAAMIAASDKVEIRFEAPPGFVEKLDIRFETFSVGRFAQALREARQSCLMIEPNQTATN